MLDTLIMLRHGSYNESEINGCLNQAGKEQIRKISSSLRKILDYSKPIKYISSNQKRAIQSAILLSTELGNKTIPEINPDFWTQREHHLFGQILWNFYEQVKDLEGTVIVVSHKEMLQLFPGFSMFKNWQCKSYSGTSCGQGYYFNFKDKTYESIPFEESFKKVIPVIEQELLF